MKKVKTFSNATATFVSQYCFNLGLKRFALPQADPGPGSLPGVMGIKQRNALPARCASRPRECREVTDGSWGNANGRAARWRSLRRFFFLFALLAGTTLVHAAGNSGEDWPRFLGPHANGISDETGLIDEFGSNGPPLLWEKKIGTGYGAPAVMGNRLVVHHRIGGEEIVECLDATDGKTLWHFGYPSAFQDPYGYNNGPRSSPVLTSNLCYTLGAEGKLVCLELATGKLVWERDTGIDFNVPEAFFGVGSTPILEGGLLIVMAGGQPDSGVVAFDPQTGKTVWQSVGKKNWDGAPMIGWPGERTVHWQLTDKQASYSTPVAATIHGKRQVLCLTRQGLVSLDPKNGEVNFSFWFRSEVNDSVNAMSPVVVDDMIFISAAYYKIGSVLLRVKPDCKGVEEVWRSTALEIHWTTPIYLNGFLYAFSGRNEPDARFRCVEFKTGKVMWDVDERWIHNTLRPDVYGRGSSIFADGRLYAVGEGGLLGIIKPTPEKFEEICRYQVPQLHYPCWAAPVLSRKKLYLRGEGELVCFNLGK